MILLAKLNALMACCFYDPSHHRNRVLIFEILLRLILQERCLRDQGQPERDQEVGHHRDGQQDGEWLLHRPEPGIWNVVIILAYKGMYCGIFAALLSPVLDGFDQLH